MRYGTVLSFQENPEEIVDHYASILPDLKKTVVIPHSEVTGGEPGTALLVGFTLGGQTFTVMQGLPDTLNPAVSIEVRTDSQEESDRIYDALLQGGSEMACGWVTDRYGLSWQVSPQELLDLVSDPDPERALAANKAMQEQKKIDMEPIRAAVAAVSGGTAPTVGS